MNPEALMDEIERLRREFVRVDEQSRGFRGRFYCDVLYDAMVCGGI